MHDHTNNLFIKYKQELVSHINKKFKDGEIILNDFKRFIIDSHMQFINKRHENTIKTLQDEIKTLQERTFKALQENIEFDNIKEKLKFDCNSLQFKLLQKEIDLGKLTAANDTLNKYISNLKHEVDKLSIIRNCPDKALDNIKKFRGSMFNKSTKDIALELMYVLQDFEVVCLNFSIPLLNKTYLFTRCLDGEALNFFKLHLISLPFQKAIEIFKHRYLHLYSAKYLTNKSKVFAQLYDINMQNKETFLQFSNRIYEHAHLIQFIGRAPLTDDGLIDSLNHQMVQQYKAGMLCQTSVHQALKDKNFLTMTNAIVETESLMPELNKNVQSPDEDKPPIKMNLTEYLKNCTYNQFILGLYMYSVSNLLIYLINNYNYVF